MTDRGLFPALTAACLYARDRARPSPAPSAPSASRAAVVRRYAVAKSAAAAG